MDKTCFVEQISVSKISEYHIKLITLNRAEDEGRLTAETCLELCHILTEAEEEPFCASVILTGSGDSFCMGARIEVGPDKTPLLQPFMLAFQKLHALLENMLKPVFVAVNGKTGGGGMTLLAAADQVFAASEAQFSLPEIKNGGCPAFALRKLNGQIPRKALLEMVYSGMPKTGDELSRYGFVRVTSQMDPLNAAISEARFLAAYQLETLKEIKAVITSKR